MLGVKNRPTPSQISADIAQFGKRKVCNPKVAGSSPLCATIFLPTMFVCRHVQVKTHNQNDSSVTNQIEYTGLRQDSYL